MHSARMRRNLVSQWAGDGRYMIADVFGVGGFVVLVVVLGSLVVAVWALFDAAIRPGPAFKAAGQSKALWIILPIVGVFLFTIVGGIAGVVYLSAIRPKVEVRPARLVVGARPRRPGGRWAGRASEKMGLPVDVVGTS